MFVAIKSGNSRCCFGRVVSLSALRMESLAAAVDPASSPRQRLFSTITTRCTSTIAVMATNVAIGATTTTTESSLPWNGCHHYHHRNHIPNNHGTHNGFGSRFGPRLWFSSEIATTTTTTSAAASNMMGTSFSKASKDTIRQALTNPETVVVDVRTVDELTSIGFWNVTTTTVGAAAAAKWVHAPGTLQDNPLLKVAAHGLIPNKDAPVIVYCAKGLRAAKSKEILEAQGYTNVLNVGGYPDDMKDI